MAGGAVECPQCGAPVRTGEQIGAAASAVGGAHRKPWLLWLLGCATVLLLTCAGSAVAGLLLAIAWTAPVVREASEMRDAAAAKNAELESRENGEIMLETQTEK